MSTNGQFVFGWGENGIAHDGNFTLPADQMALLEKCFGKRRMRCAGLRRILRHNK